MEGCTAPGGVEGARDGAGVEQHEGEPGASGARGHVEGALLGRVIRPAAKEVLAQPGTGRGEVVAWQFPELGGILRPRLQGTEQAGALVDAVAGKAHEQVAGLEVAGLHLQQGFLGRWAELTAEAKLLAHLR